MRDTFIQAGGSGAEAMLVNTLRQQHAITLSLVAVDQDQVVGYLLFSPVTVQFKTQQADAYALGPVAVKPSHQKQGIGTSLIQAGLGHCKKLCHSAVFVLGHADYYPRFGFRPASDFGIRCEFNVPDEAFMAIELKTDALTHVQGVVHYHPAFQSV